MEAKQILERLIQKENLPFNEAESLMTKFMEGRLTSCQMASILIALRMKEETVDEIAACAKIMREKSIKIPVESEIVIDTCGTGGDRSGSFNISTTVALLLAGAGYKIAKHGNRSMTSKSGSADVLEALGVHLDLSPQQVSECISRANIGFMFAPALHTAMKNVMPVRKEIAVRTIFNLLGPLTNPAGAQYQVIGLFSNDYVSRIAAVLKRLGTASAYVFSGLSGLDEVCIAGNTKVARLNKEGDITEFIFDPEAYGYSKAPLDSISGGSPPENAEITKALLRNELAGPKRDIVIMNTGFAISAVEDCSLEDAFGKADTFLKEKVGMKAIENLVTVSNSYGKKS